VVVMENLPGIRSPNAKAESSIRPLAVLSRFQFVCIGSNDILQYDDPVLWLALQERDEVRQAVYVLLFVYLALKIELPLVDHELADIRGDDFLRKETVVGEEGTKGRTQAHDSSDDDYHCPGTWNMKILTGWQGYRFIF